MCDYDLDDVVDGPAPGADVVTLPADLAAELRGLVPGPLDAAVCAILRAWAVRAAENMGLVRSLDND